jgi:carboxyl-terminal processing protease
MKRNLAYVLIVLLVSAASCSFTSKTFNDPDKDKLLIDLISYVLERGHFSPKDMDDKFSENVFYDFINDLDPFKRYFLQSDIEEFEKYKYEIDNQLKETNIVFFNAVYKRYETRLKEAKDIYKKVLKQPFDFGIEEKMNVDYENLPFATTKRELQDRWRKQLKFTTISTFDNRLKKEVSLKESDDNYVMKSAVEIEKEARETTKNSMDEFFEFMDDQERKDAFAQFINSVVEEFDPHTFYFAPEVKDRFDINMSGKYQGIGARLQKRNGSITITEVLTGGPVWRDKLLDVGDEILKVSRENAEPIEITGMRLDDAIKYIKGPEGTVVDLTVRRVDGTIEVVSVERGLVELEETYAKTALVEKESRKFGLINLPKFYIDFENYDNRNAASDVAKEIARLKEQGMQGLVLDLRSNGGGSLRTVVDMAGLFIKEGPIVQVKSSGKKKDILKDTDKGILWNGPLVILVNELSASASEILAAAMQDYKRAVIIGSKQTFGKGTVQNVLDLNQFVKGNEYGDIGALKLTTQKFYRINGGSTQLEGVKSDVVVPDRFSYIDIGEKDENNPLPWDKIDAAFYQTWDGYIDYEETIERSAARMAANKQLQLIEENARWVKEQREVMDVSLNYHEYRREVSIDKRKVDYFRKIADYNNKLSFSSLPYELEQMLKDPDLKEERKRWHESLTKDVYVEEAINVLEDLQMNNIKQKKAVTVKG